MPIAANLADHLQRYGIIYERQSHNYTNSSARTAQAAHVPGHQLAKAVVLKREDESYLVMVLPADHRVHLGRLHQLLAEPVGLATEAELGTLFTDCDAGAIVPVGAAYGLDTLIDSRLLTEPEVYIESGDHQTLLKLSGAEFCRLMATAKPVDVAKHL